jgi:hypothetical protein
MAMAKGKKTGGRDFAPGDVSGPGRPRMSKDIKEMKKISTLTFVSLVQQFLQMRVSDLDQISKAKNALVFHALIASVLKKGIEQGDGQRLNIFLDRIIGKVRNDAVVEVRPKIIENTETGRKIILTVEPVEKQSSDTQ